MQVLPITIPPEEDELPSSWIYRTSKANLFGSLDQFIRTFVRAKASKGYQYLRYDDTEEFLTFYLAQQSRTPMAETYLKTTCYGGLAPFMTSGQQVRRLNVSFRRTYGKPEFTPKVTSYTRELCRCKQCQSEELENMGFWYYHRAHQLPGVRVCHKHGSLLEVFKGKLGQEFDQNAPFVPATPNTSDDIMQRYAVFAKEILDMAPDGDASNTKQAIWRKLQMGGYSDHGSDYKKLNHDIARKGMAQMFPVEMHRYLELQLALLSYPSVEQTIALAFFLFETSGAFVNSLSESTCSRFQKRLDEGGYDLVGSFRRNLIQLQHECGTEFCATAEGFASGWSCPRCDADKSNQEILERLVSCTGDNEYSCQSEFEGINAKVTLLHKKCGNILEKSASRFLFEKRRCDCERNKRKHALIKHMSLIDTFRLLKYVPSTGRVHVFHQTCGKSFECNYDYFMVDMRCPHCESGVKPGLRPTIDAVELQRRMKELVGDEYTLESTEINKGTPVRIRHNKCGKTDFYYHGKFLIGQRCSRCRTRYDGHAIRELIPYLTNEEYEVSHMDGDGACVIQHLESGKEYSMRLEYILQELTRRTPSPKLPCKLPPRPIQDFLPSSVETLYENTLVRLKETHGIDAVIFRSDFKVCGANKAQTNHIIAKMMKHGLIERFDSGVYKWKGGNFTRSDVIQKKYICRDGKRFGYLYGCSFAYEIGLRKIEPKMLHIMTNSESRIHGRDVRLMDTALYLRGSENEITTENWKILQLLDFLQCPKKYADADEKQIDAVLRKHIKENSLSVEQAEPYLAQYPDWVETKLRKLCGEAL